MYIVTRLFNLYAEYIILNARLYNSQVGIKITRRNSSNLRYADNTTLMAETEEKLKSLLMRVKEESEKMGSNPHIQKAKIIACSFIIGTSGKRNEEKVIDFVSLGSKDNADSNCSDKIKRQLLLRRKAVTNLGSMLKSRDTLCRQRST